MTTEEIDGLEDGSEVLVRMRYHKDLNADQSPVKVCLMSPINIGYFYVDIEFVERVP